MRGDPKSAVWKSLYGENAPEPCLVLWDDSAVGPAPSSQPTLAAALLAIQEQHRQERRQAFLDLPRDVAASIRKRWADEDDRRRTKTLTLVASSR